MPVYTNRDEVVQVTCKADDLENVLTLARNFVDMLDFLMTLMSIESGIRNNESYSAISRIEQAMGDEWK